MSILSESMLKDARKHRERAQTPTVSNNRNEEPVSDIFESGEYDSEPDENSTSGFSEDDIDSGGYSVGSSLDNIGGSGTSEQSHGSVRSQQHTTREPGQINFEARRTNGSSSGLDSELRRTAQPVLRRRGSWLDSQVKKLENRRGRRKQEETPGKKLTAVEAAQTREQAATIILWSTEQFDLIIQATTKGHVYQEIWSDITVDDADVLVHVLQQWAKDSTQGARLYREFLTWYDKARAGAIIGPRLAKTMMRYYSQGVSLMW